ncbi:unnamed protein product [Caenorhabditis sp. 36 PRJEB53466]|nr:unnamed protein product [Caenorhabditis sp. 36 PRJEB53466]
MASFVVVAAGAVLAVSVPFLALKELLDGRLRANFQKHLKRRHRCQVSFHASKNNEKEKDEQSSPARVPYSLDQVQRPSSPHRATAKSCNLLHMRNALFLQFNENAGTYLEIFLVESKKF